VAKNRCRGHSGSLFLHVVRNAVCQSTARSCVLLQVWRCCWRCSSTLRPPVSNSDPGLPTLRFTSTDAASQWSSPVSCQPMSQPCQRPTSADGRRSPAAVTGTLAHLNRVFSLLYRLAQQLHRCAKSFSK